MKDFLGRTIHLGDRIVYSCSTQSGGISMSTHQVQGFTNERVVVPKQGSFGREVKYLQPENCVIYRFKTEEEAMLRNLEGILEHLEMYNAIKSEVAESESDNPTGIGDNY